MSTKTYLVSEAGGTAPPRIVVAASRNSALRHVARDHFVVQLAKPADVEVIATLLATGQRSIEQAGYEVEDAEQIDWVDENPNVQREEVSA